MNRHWKPLPMLLVLLTAFVAVGCESHPAHETRGTRWMDLGDQPAQQAPAPAKKAAPAPVPAEAGRVRSVVYYPTTNRDSSVIMVDHSAPASVAVGAPYTYDIIVTNLTNAPVYNVVVSDALASNFAFEKAEPAPASNQNGTLTFPMGDFGPRETKTIRVTGAAKEAGSVRDCVSLVYDLRACLEVAVVQPALQLTKSAPAEVLLCDPIPVKYVVTNTGTGVARNVVITDQLPKGIVTEDMKTSVTLNVGDLAAGQSREMSVVLKATDTGQYASAGNASAEGGLKAQASAGTTVREPVLAITKEGPANEFIGRPITYQVTVTNNGDAPSRDTIVEDVLPAGTTLVSASDGGVPSAGKVTWNLGTIEPKASRKVSVTVRAGAPAELVNGVSARGVCAKTVQASARTKVTGIPAILLEVVDLEDPIAVGNNDTYLITVTNQGSAVGTNIKIVATLEDSMEYISATGATVATAAGNTITFAPLPSLEPKAKAEFRVVVKAAKAGDVRFKVTMNSDQLTRPVEETEATNFYQ